MDEILNKYLSMDQLHVKSAAKSLTCLFTNSLVSSPTRSASMGSEYYFADILCRSINRNDSPLDMSLASQSKETDLETPFQHYKTLLREVRLRKNSKPVQETALLSKQIFTKASSRIGSSRNGNAGHQSYGDFLPSSG